MTSGSLMKVESIAECSPWSILQYFWPALSYNWSWKPFFGLFKSGCFTQVLLFVWLMACSLYIVVDSDYKWSCKLKFPRNDFPKYKKNLSIKTWNALCNKSIKFQSSIYYLDKMHFKAKMPIFFLFVYENIWCECHWKCLIKTLQMSTQNICFCWEMRKIAIQMSR